MSIGEDEMTRTSPEQWSKARAAIGEGRVRRDAEYADVWWVGNHDLSQTYRVQVTRDQVDRSVDFLTCTCPYGLNTGVDRDKYCYHVAAVRILVGDTGNLEPRAG